MGHCRCREVIPKLVNFLAMTCVPFEPAERQALLECEDVAMRRPRGMLALMDMTVQARAHGDDGEEADLHGTLGRMTMR